jgi:hypothetical protein
MLSCGSSIGIWGGDGRPPGPIKHVGD